MKNRIVLSLLTLLICTQAHATTINLPSTSGTTISGEFYGDYAGESIISVGDVDGNFVPDLLISAKAQTPNANFGAVYLISTPMGGLPANISLYDIGKTVAGTKITGLIPSSPNSGGYIGETIVGLGDLNGDKLNEFAITARGENAVYIVDGNKNFPSTFRLNDVGKTIPGVKFSNIPQGASYSMASGDVDGDGKMDLVMGAKDNGDVYVFFGSKLPANGEISLANESYLDGVRGFKISIPGAYNRTFVDVADVNRDGTKDILMANHSLTKAFIYFGKKTPFSPTVTLNNTVLNGTDAVAILTGWNINAWTVNAIGDINGDNFTDFALRGQNSFGQSDIGIVFGQATWPATMDLSTDLDGQKGFILRGVALNQTQIDLTRAIASAGDFNNDTISDLIVGDYMYNGSGRAVIIYGRKTWPAIYTLGTDDNTQILGSGFTGTSVSYAENLFGGIGCATDTAYLIGAPGYGQNLGHAYIVNIKK